MGIRFNWKIAILFLLFKLSNCHNNNLEYQYDNYMYFYKDVYHKKIIFNNTHMVCVNDYEKNL